MKPFKLNHRQHRFALNILAGMPPQQAYVKAGYSDSPIRLDCGPYQLLGLPKVEQFIEGKRRLKETAVVTADTVATIASPNERKQILTELLRAQLVDFQDSQGEPQLTKDTPHARAAKEYYHRRKVDKDGNPIITKSIKLVDPVAAIQELNKMDGAYAPSKHLHGVVRYNVSFVKKGRNSEEMADGSATLTMQDTGNGATPVFYEER